MCGYVARIRSKTNKKKIQQTNLRLNAKKSFIKKQLKIRRRKSLHILSILFKQWPVLSTLVVISSLHFKYFVYPFNVILYRDPQLPFLFLEIL